MSVATPVSVILLAGGKSRRMGRNKALLPWHGVPLIQHIVERLTEVSRDILLVTNTPQEYAFLNLPMVPDVVPNGGSLVGLYSGLEAIRHPWGLVMACDVPFVNTDLLSYMLSLREGYQAVVPVMGDRHEPLHALYHKSCLPAMRRHIDAGDKRIISFYPEIRIRFLREDEIDRFDPEHLSFLNANTPEDWERILSMDGGDR
jgi:molybdopterin-guanine dinucleotide biosynthesis protein A